MKETEPLEPAFKIDFFLSQPHECGYFPKRSAMSLFADPDHAQAFDAYQRLIALGFRRSGRTIYRPQCLGCRACTPLRIDATRFQPNRSQRRNWSRNADIGVRETPSRYDPEHFAIYKAYIAARHANGGMDNPTPSDYEKFLCLGIPETMCYEFRVGEKLIGVAFVDVLEDAMSAVYTFFDPNESHRGLGTYAILWQIKAVATLNKTWLYLGYWIKDCSKMVYKQAFRPAQVLVDGRWQAFDDARHNKNG